MIDIEKHKRMANAIRALSMDAVQKAKSGHPGLPMGAADIATVLFTQHMKFDPKAPAWADRDRFVLSAGHGSMLLYSLLYLLGYEDITLEEIKNFRQFGARTAGHPEYGHAAGIETTTGPLGQGIGNAVGMALSERMMAAEYGAEVVDHYTYTLVGDGCLMEGISQEAISFAGHLKLNKLIVLWDDNGISIDGKISLTDSTDQRARFEASGWNTLAVDGHDPIAISAALDAAKSADRPTMIACKTTIGYGAPSKAGTSGAHGAPLGEDEIAGTREALDWPHKPFEIPSDILDNWRIAGLNASHAHKEWEKNLGNMDPSVKAEYSRRISGELPSGFEDAIIDYKKQLSLDAPKVATRKSSEMALEVINSIIPETIGGSADLTGSNNTRTKGMLPVSAGDYGQRFIHWGIREHGMSAAMNGMALHGGTIPYSGGFLIFSDYARGAIRLAALMGIRVIHVMTHDSIGLGEDGPTHQPVEHLASLRAMPNLMVFRPADAVETAEAWQMALETTDAPSVLALTRQNVPTVRTEHTDKNLVSFGAYELSPAEGEADISIFATGSEIEIALDAKSKLSNDGLKVRVVSVPCFELFEKQSPEYRAEILGKASVNVGVEAAIGMGWERFIGTDGIFVGMTGFGTSAPIADLYKSFGITSDNIVEQVKAKLAQ
ncbi:MAG: transketolase [Cohaesibacteraceae bacterium]|nr:transketolase [Cohaesibacteraceae bacterium]MBL4876995.1 transketolase [Cohaesibacteraceae bacterium]